MVGGPLVVESTITIALWLKTSQPGYATVFQTDGYKAATTEFTPAWRWRQTQRQAARNRFCKKTHLPEALELPLLDAEQLAGLPADDGGVARRVVQDGLPERRADPQRADGDCILYTDTPERVVENGRK